MANNDPSPMELSIRHNTPFYDARHIFVADSSFVQSGSGHSLDPLAVIALGSLERGLYVLDKLIMFNHFCMGLNTSLRSHTYYFCFQLALPGLRVVDEPQVTSLYISISL